MAKIVLRSYQEENAYRRRVRIIALFIASPLIAIILLYCGKVLSMELQNHSVRTAYSDGSYDISATEADRLKVVNIFQSWLAYYNAGTARLKTGEIDEAILDLREALDLVDPYAIPGVCYVRSNLAIAYELAGDREAEAGRIIEAVGFYEMGLQTLMFAPLDCTPPSGGAGDDGEGEGEEGEGENGEGQSDGEGEGESEGSDGQNGGDGGEDNNDTGQDGNSESDKDNQSNGDKMKETKERLEQKRDQASGDGKDETDSKDTSSAEDKIREQTEQSGRDRTNKEGYEQGERGSGQGGGGAGGEYSKPW